jgi:hypothetical protein
MPHYPPLISPRSPSYERAWREFPHPTQDEGAETVALLARLAEAEQNASSLCRRMLPAVSEAGLAEVVREHADLHAARRQKLGELVERFGGSPPTDAECRVLLTRAADDAGQVVSQDDAQRVLTTMRDELAAEYNSALATERLDPPTRDALRALAP